MINLENVLIDDETKQILKILRIINGLNEDEYITYRDLGNMIKDNPVLKRSLIEDKYNNAEKKVLKNNALGKEPIIYTTTGYSDSRLLYTDSVTLGYALILSNVTNDYPVSYIELNYLSIEKIKKYLSYCTLSGKNYLQQKFRKIGNINLKKILISLDMYEQQVIRQSNLTEDKDINIFSLDRQRKHQVVNDLYADIVNYLVENTNERFVWGTMSTVQKEKLLLSIIGKGKASKLIRGNLVDVISNYTTIEELENIRKNDYKVLKRFIVK